MSADPPPETAVPVTFRWPKFFVTLGILLPLLTLIAEAMSGICGEFFCDPIPSRWHIGLLLVPIATNLAIYLKVRGRKIASMEVLRWALGISFVVNCYYGIGFAWIGGFCGYAVFYSLCSQWSLEALFFGWPVLMGMSPMLGWLAWWSARGKLRRLRQESLRLWKPILAGIVLLGSLEVPTVITRLWIEDANRPKSPHHTQALSLVRAVGDHDLIHRACYRQGDSSLEMAGWWMQGTPFKMGGITRERFNMSTDEARRLYYRITGHMFSDVKPKRMLNRERLIDRDDIFSLSADEEFVWDGDRGSDDVGARLRGLSLVTSSMEWNIESAAGLAYGEWTFEFENSHANPQEARCQIQLPPGSTVSRLTLWVNGEPREAAFDAKSKVTGAYKQIVQVERRDPVLVNMIGPDRVMMQCFPVPEKGGRMKVRMGITAPVDASTQCKLWMPSLSERNFTAPAPHQLTLLSDADLAGSQSHEQTLTVKTGELPHTSVAMAIPIGTAPVWTEDRFAKPDQRFLRRESHVEPAPAWDHVCVVVDTSAGNAAAKSAVRAALEKLMAQGTQLTLLLPHDLGFDVVSDRSALLSALQAARFVGGRDNTAAVHEALRLAKAKGSRAMVLWLHGAQPIKFEENKVDEYKPTQVPLYPIALSPGPNRVLEQLYQHEPVQASRPWSSESDLASAVTAPPMVSHAYTRAPSAPTDGATKVSDQLARHWAFTEVMEAFRGTSDVPSNEAALASRYQLVTPYSGAVVLETRAQYVGAGLTPIDPNTAPQLPGTPEPSRALLVLIAGGIGLLRRRRA